MELKKENIRINTVLVAVSLKDCSLL